MKSNPVFVILFAISICLSSCNLSVKKQADPPVARVFDKYLYTSDLKDAIPENAGKSDSITLAKRYINTWVKDQLLLHRAEEVLSDEQKDFEKQIEEYRKSLLIYSYEQKLLQQKLDTIVSDSEIQDYYDSNANNFLLNQEVIKATFIKIPLNISGTDKVRRWSRSNDSADVNQLEKFCINYADKYDNFNNQWVYFSRLKEEMPLKIDQPSRYFRYNQNIETTDSSFRYFLHITAMKGEGEIAPLEMVNEDIRSIILNKRKIEFFQSLETRLFNEGLSRNQFEIY